MRPIAAQTYKDIMDFPQYMLPIYHDYFKNFHHSNNRVKKFASVTDDKDDDYYFVDFWN
jgi:hypothetical protein